jgi:alpha-tubulin suppressor-like RCC1 family protein
MAAVLGHRVRGLGLSVALFLAACGSREGLFLDDAFTDTAGVGGASVARAGAFSAGAPSRAGAPPIAGGAPGAGAFSAGAGGAVAAGAGGAAVACMTGGFECPNGFDCIDGACATHCTSSAQCRDNHFCAGYTCPLKALQIAAGVSDTCVSLVDGSLRCWGDGTAGQLGDGLQLTSSAPVAVQPVPNQDSGLGRLALGNAFACVVTLAGTGSCWGAGDLGQLGAGTLNPSPTPVQIAGFGSADPLLAIAAGRYHACGLLNSGGVHCWGANFDGQLGDGSTTSSVVPVATAENPTNSRIASGDAHTCVLSGGAQIGDQSVLCWGDNSELQLGAPGIPNSTTPVSVQGLDSPTGVAIELAAGSYHTCARYSDGPVRCWGDNSQQQLGAPLPTQAQPFQVDLGQEYALQVSAGERHTCALMNVNEVRCWGNGAASGMGVNAAPTAPVPVQGLADSAVSSIAAGATHTCALMADGSVRCWGSNNDGALGVPNLEYSATAVQVLPW